MINSAITLIVIGFSATKPQFSRWKVAYLRLLVARLFYKVNIISLWKNRKFRHSGSSSTGRLGVLAPSRGGGSEIAQPIGPKGETEKVKWLTPQSLWEKKLPRKSKRKFNKIHHREFKNFGHKTTAIRKSAQKFFLQKIW